MRGSDRGLFGRPADLSCGRLDIVAARCWQREVMIPAISNTLPDEVDHEADGDHQRPKEQEGRQ